MNWTDRWRAQPKPRAASDLRKFGFVMAVAFGLIGGLMLWRGRAPAPYLIGLAGAFALFAVVVPAALRPVERGWLWLGERIGRVMTTVIVGLMYFLVVTPIGLVKRLVSGDSMGLKLDRAAPSHWLPVDPAGPASRPNKPF
jgi:hypothetical protein